MKSLQNIIDQHLEALRASMEKKAALLRRIERIGLITKLVYTVDTEMRHPDSVVNLKVNIYESFRTLREEFGRFENCGLTLKSCPKAGQENTVIVSIRPIDCPQLEVAYERELTPFDKCKVVETTSPATTSRRLVCPQ